MKFHLGSFLLGVVVGATGAAAAKRLRPVAVELLALGMRGVEVAQARVAVARETIEDVIAEARARARGLLGEEEPIVIDESAPSGRGEAA
jgi:hypothetical protein